MPIPDELARLGTRIADANTVVLASHTRPDGDAIGSLLGLGLSLEKAGKSVTLLNQDSVPHSLRFLPGSDRIRRPQDIAPPSAVDLFIALDTSTEERIGARIWEWLPSNTERAAIDHHRSHIPYAEHTYVDAEAPATGEILADLIRGMDWPLTREEAWSLWAAISTDTGSFQYPATTAHTLEVAAALVHAGADPGALSQSLYQSFPERRLRLLQRLLNTLDLRADGRIASWRLRQSDLQELRIQPGDTEGLIDHLRAIEGVVVAISFEERGDQDDTIRVSARSKDATVADVSQLCEAFGGGGHRLAAGAALPGPLDQAAETFLERINQSLNHGSDH